MRKHNHPYRWKSKLVQRGIVLEAVLTAESSSLFSTFIIQIQELFKLWVFCLGQSPVSLLAMNIEADKPIYSPVVESHLAPNKGISNGLMAQAERTAHFPFSWLIIGLRVGK